MNLTVSMLITPFNRGHLLLHTIKRLKELRLPNEIVIVDDGSQDDTTSIIRELGKDLPIPIKYIYLHRPDWTSCSKARNVGLRMCEGDIILGQEAEILQITPAVSMFKDLIQRFPNHIINGANIYFQGESLTLDKRFYTYPHLIYMSPFREITKDEPVNSAIHQGGFTHSIGWIAPFIYAVKREHLLKISGWREDFRGWGSEDTDLITRLGCSGIAQYQNTDIESIHLWHDRPPQFAMENTEYNVALITDADYEHHPENITVAHDDWGKITEEDYIHSKEKGVPIDDYVQRFNLK